MLRDLTRVKDIVKMLLIKYPELRDNDELLIMQVNEILGYAKKERHNIYGVGYFIPERLLREKKIVKFESIRRTRQKLQQEIPELRGKEYAKRQQEAKFIRQFMKRV